MMSLLSTCTTPSCTRTGTTPRGLTPTNHELTYFRLARSTGCDTQSRAFSRGSTLTFCEQLELWKCNKCRPRQDVTSRVVI
jgi:hypothetical protein